MKLELYTQQLIQNSNSKNIIINQTLKSLYLL